VNNNTKYFLSFIVKYCHLSLKEKENLHLVIGSLHKHFYAAILGPCLKLITLLIDQPLLYGNIYKATVDVELSPFKPKRQRHL
jgi:hypothetical protein